MKILTLDLTAFGPFSDLRLDLSGGSGGLHLIHGPNEAGKSSTLRALSDFFFGVPERSTDDFIHKYADLRIGATLRDSAGNTATLIRRKGRRPTLRTPEGDARDDSVLTPFLGRLTREEFERHHRIDHDQLVRGGRAMIEGEGDFGRMLFAAGSGVAGFRGVLSKFEEEAKALFAPRAQNAGINAALAALKSKRQERAKLSLPTKTWVEADEGKTRREAALARLDAELRRLSAEKRRLERIGQRLPGAAKLREARRKLEALADVRPLPDDFAERRAKARHARPEAIRRRDEARLELAKVDEELDRLGGLDPLVEDADEIRRLVEEKSGYLKARDALPAQRREIDLLADRVRRLTLEIAPESDLETAEIPPVPPRVRKGIEKLRDEFIRLSAQHDEAAAEAAAIDDGSPATDEGPGEAVDNLRLGHKRRQAHGRIDETIAERRAALAAAVETADTSLRRLPRWSGTLDELLSADFPSSETVDRFEDERAGRERSTKNVETRVQEVDEEIARLDAESAREKLDGGAPSESDLDDARERRDALWTTIRDSADRPAPERLLSYEKAFRECDLLADRLRREADRAARRAAREAGREAASVKRDKLVRKLDEDRRAAAEAFDAWRSLWLPFGIEPGTPKEMLGWLKKRDDLVAKSQAVRAAGAELDSAEEIRRGLVAEIGRGWADVGAAAPDPEESLASLLDRTQGILDRIDRRARLVEARKQAERTRDELEAWRGRWLAAVEPVDPRLDPDSAPEHFVRRDELIRAREELASKRAEAEAREAAVAAFERRTRSLAERRAPESLGLAADRAAAELVKRFQEAQKADQRRGGCLDSREGILKREADALAELATAEAALKILEEEAGTEDLLRAEADWSEAKDLRARVEALEEGLLASGDGLDLEAILAELDATNSEEIAVRIADVEARMRPLEAERDETNREVGRLTKDLEQWDGGSRAAEAEEEAQALLAKVAGDAESYLRLKLGAAFLRKAMERYREKNAGPILARAGGIFSELTLGSFADLRVDEEEDGRWVLNCVRPDGRDVAVSGLSEGTADALYLALRLAALRAEIEGREPVPFVVDDILVNLDERRAEAAIGALAELSGHTQVLLFTHHAHVVEIARKRLVDGESLFVHELPGSTAAIR